MKDMMMEIYNKLCLNEFISLNVTAERIKFYEVPETLDVTKPFIIIDVFSPQSNAYFASNKEMSKQFNYQLSVESQDRIMTKRLSREISYIMRDFGFVQLKDGLDEYFSETKRFVEAHRYRKNTQIYDIDY